MKLFNNIQRHLLLNYPILWSSRIVPAFVLSGLMNILLFFFFYAITSPFDSDYSYATWSSFLTLSSIIAIIVYLIFLLRFNHFKNFGILKWSDFALQFLLFFITLGSIIVWPFMPKIAAHVSVSNSFDSVEMQNDLQDAYLIANQLEYTQATAPYRKVEITIVGTFNQEQADNVNNTIRVSSESHIDKSKYVKLERTSDSTFIGYERISLVCDSYVYGIWNNDEFNQKVYKSLPGKIENVKEKQEKLNTLFAKYIRGYNGSIYTDHSSNPFDDGSYNNYSLTEPVPIADYNGSVCDKYRLTEMSNYVDRISGKIITPPDFKTVFRLWFYLTFYASILLLIFRYMSPRTFLWTLLFAFLLFVFTMIVGFASSFEEIGFLAIMLFYYLVFTGVSISIFFSKSRNVFQGIALNLSFFHLFLVPLVSTALYYEITIDGLNVYWDYQARDMSFEIAEIVGVVLVLISSLVFHSRLFYKWYSLPEE